MKWSDFIDGQRMKVKQQKTKKTNDTLILKAPQVLLTVLKGVPRVHDCILTHKWRRPFMNASSLSHRIKETLTSIEAHRYSMHGLRKNAGIMLAENGATVPQIMAVLGHKTPKMALYYVRLANQRLLAAKGADIMDRAVEAKRAARAAVRRAGLREVG